jgi:hypothetical protein
LLVVVAAVVVLSFAAVLLWLSPRPPRARPAPGGHRHALRPRSQHARLGGGRALQQPARLEVPDVQRLGRRRQQQLAARNAGAAAAACARGGAPSSSAGGEDHGVDLLRMLAVERVGRGGVGDGRGGGRGGRGGAVFGGGGAAAAQPVGAPEAHGALGATRGQEAARRVPGDAQDLGAMAAVATHGLSFYLFWGWFSVVLF